MPSSMFFVVSTGRSGTYSIAKLLNAARDTVCLHEPEPRLLGEITQYLYGDLSHDAAVALLRETRPVDRSCRHYGEAHHRLSFMIPALHAAFPEAKFIWLIRDGRPTTASLYARQAYSGRMFTGDSNVMLWETTRPRADRLGLMSRREWRGLTRFEKCCWHWTYKNRLIEQAFQRCGCAWLFLRLEDLDARAHELHTFLGLEPPDQLEIPRLNIAQPVLGREIPQDWKTWTAEQAGAFERFCGTAMDTWYPGWREETVGVWPSASVRATRLAWVKRQFRRNVDVYEVRHFVQRRMWPALVKRVPVVVRQTVKNLWRKRITHDAR